jgi:ABC-type nitrate/sulfonate/bicarbonate transport system substrate-binding protein
LKQNDYQILPLVEVPNILTALIAGQVDAGVVSPPTNSRARKAGLNELMNLAKEGPEFVSVAIGTSRSYIKANEDTVRRVVRSYAEGVQLFKTNKAAAQRMMQKYLRVKEQDILDDAYSQFREYLEYRPMSHAKQWKLSLPRFQSATRQRRILSRRFHGYALCCGARQTGVF